MQDCLYPTKKNKCNICKYRTSSILYLDTALKICTGITSFEISNAGLVTKKLTRIDNEWMHEYVNEYVNVIDWVGKQLNEIE